MNCSEVRFSLEAEPGTADPAVAAHLQRCASCATYGRELRELDTRLHAALEVVVPAARPLALDSFVATHDETNVVTPLRPAVGPLRRATRYTGRLALAASVAAVAVVAGLLWAAFPRESLAADVVGHMAHEPSAWSTTQALPASRVDDVLNRRDLALRAGTVDVTYAQTCWFRGRRVPHLVVQTPTGPVTVMVLTHETVVGRTAFDEGGYHGVIVPATHGSLAVLGRGTADVDAAAASALAALDYH